MTEMGLHSASQNGKLGLGSPCDYTAHKGLLFLLSEAPTSSWRPGAPGAACESPSVEEPEPDSARRRFHPGYLGKGLAVARGSRRWGGGDFPVRLILPFPAASKAPEEKRPPWGGSSPSRLSSAQLSQRLAVCPRALHSVPHHHRSLRSGVNGRCRVTERGLT